jgi:hypothetical protein
MAGAAAPAKVLLTFSGTAAERHVPALYRFAPDAPQADILAAYYGRQQSVVRITHAAASLLPCAQPRRVP